MQDNFKTESSNKLQVNTSCVLGVPKVKSVVKLPNINLYLCYSYVQARPGATSLKWKVVSGWACVVVSSLMACFEIATKTWKEIHQVIKYDMMISSLISCICCFVVLRVWQTQNKHQETLCTHVLLQFNNVRMMELTIQQEMGIYYSVFHP